jgi:hypothetical protein
MKIIKTTYLFSPTSRRAACTAAMLMDPHATIPVVGKIAGLHL